MGKVVMEDLKIKVEAPFAVYPAETKAARSMFLSNIDQTLVAPVGTLSFFSAPPTMTFQEVVDSYVKALSQMLVTYDFMAGRLKLNEEEDRLEIECNGAGAFFAVASTDLTMDDLGDIATPNLAFRRFVLCDYVALSHQQPHLPLFTLQATRFKCGGFVVGAGLNHCILDGISCFHMMINLASIAMGKGLPITPFVDRALLKARDPPTIAYQHNEYSKISELPPTLTLTANFSGRGKDVTASAAHMAEAQEEENVLKLFSLSGEAIERLKEKGAEEGWKCSSFEVVTALVWKARMAAVEDEDDEIATVLFPMDVRSKIEPALPKEYAGNAVIPGHARASVKEVRDEALGVLVRKVQEGLRRINDDYVRSMLDWLEVNKGIPCAVRSFSVVAWWKLGMDQVQFPWGKPLHLGPVIFSHSQDLVLLLPHHHGHGLNIVIALLPSQMSKFERILPLLLD
ncbi:hypothetical protein SUGI_1156330 [Cryptomeria japonica]|uniref:acyltransferase GLAUCE n=1 Tax=Cryptomeria japonica TaxID=3369 RepID=UPI002414BAD3|nr:acyltransferase GLAUCE [Cryptomeria japonica]GLJ54033.1 hypothetical protein SUGI_1156330 [Cryptomeria japonica]